MGSEGTLTLSLDGKPNFEINSNNAPAATINESSSLKGDHDMEPLLGVLEIDNDNNNNSTTKQHSHHGTTIPAGTANTAQMVINIIISFVGAGLLGQPHAFMRSGWLLGGIALLLVSALNVYAMLRLPVVQQALLTKHGTRTSSYSEIAYVILGSRGESIVIACLGISQAGFATGYIIFIAANLYSIAKIPRLLVCVACVPGLVGLVQFQDLKNLSPFSLLANLANFGALCAVLLQDYQSYDLHHHTTTIATTTTNQMNDTIHAIQWSGLLYVVAVTIYSMEGVGLVLSLRDSYRYPQRFETVLSVTLAAISLFMVFFGIAGSLAFGTETQAPITLNLNSYGPATFVKIALCFGLYLTYPIMMFPIWTIWESRNPSLQTDAKQRFLVRTGVVIGSAMVAFLMPNFGVFLSLVGSSICTLLAFVFPSYFHLHVLGDELPRWQYLLDVMVLVGGCLFGGLGTYQSVMAMLQGESNE